MVEQGGEHGGEGDERKKRQGQEGRKIRSLLSSYYGVGSAEDPAASDPSNIDRCAPLPHLHTSLHLISNLITLVHPHNSVPPPIDSTYHFPLTLTSPLTMHICNTHHAKHTQ